MKIVVARPQIWIDRSKARTAKIWFHDVEALYDAIPEVCKELGVDCVVKNIVPHAIEEVPGTIYLGHHTYGARPNVWHIKKGYVPGFMYWDKKGYSGWSEAVNRYDPTTWYPLDQRLETGERILNYILSNSSKIKQPNNAKIPDHDYVLVLGQRPHDTVSAHAYIDTVKLSKLVNEAYKDSRIKVYTKPHPMSLKTEFPGALIEGSMHHLIAEAKAVYTVNSGSGFESLFHEKPVYTSGACDYSPVTYVVKSLNDIKNSMYMPAIDYNKTIHFLTYCFNEHFVNCYDKESIKRKLKRCIHEYEI